MAISRAQLLKELLPGLNALFGLEYAKYGEEAAEIFETESSDRNRNQVKQTRYYRNSNRTEIEKNSILSKLGSKPQYCQLDSFLQPRLQMSIKSLKSLQNSKNEHFE